MDDVIEWKFIPLTSPHFKGLWEAAVKAVKYNFYRVTGLSMLFFEEQRTLVFQIATLLISRPLCPEDPDNLEILTLGTFHCCMSDVTELNMNILKRWQLVCYIQQVF